MIVQTLSQLKTQIQGTSVVLIDEALVDLWGEKIRAQLPEQTLYVTAPSGEAAKRIEVAAEIWHQLYTAGIGRDAILIGVGGGALCDLANFVAGCYMRGIDCALVPTSLLAMVDAAIGGKCGINSSGGKNIIGLIRQPIQIVIDHGFLSTLSQRELNSGMAEILKAGLIGDPDLFSKQLPLEEAIRRAIAVKRAITSVDEQEVSGKRALLNLGHTFGHAIEGALGFTQVCHGEAVAIGLYYAARLSVEVLGTRPDLVDEVERRLESQNLPTRLPSSLSIEDLIDRMGRDKKQDPDVQGQTVILLEEIGHAKLVHGVDRSLIAHVLGCK